MKPLHHESSKPPLPAVVGGGGERKARPQKEEALNCPRCKSTNTKFCYYNNYSLTQPRYFCKTCRRYWTEGGTLRNVPVGGGSRKNKRSSSSNTPSPNKKFPDLAIFSSHPNPNNNNPKIHHLLNELQGRQDLNLPHHTPPLGGIDDGIFLHHFPFTTDTSKTLDSTAALELLKAAGISSSSPTTTSSSLVSSLCLMQPPPPPLHPVSHTNNNSLFYYYASPPREEEEQQQQQQQQAVQDTSGTAGGRPIFLPYEELKPVSTTTVDHHHHHHHDQYHNKVQLGEISNGYWNGMLGGGGGGSSW